MAETYDAVVIGAGVVGASTAFHLAKLSARRAGYKCRTHPRTLAGALI